MNQPPREVWLIRHGESLANAGARTIEASSYGLSDAGFRQATQLASALHTEPELIVHSTYLRAKQTADPAIARFPTVPAEQWPVQEVQYLDPVKCVGTTQDERRALSHEYWQICDPHHAYPGAESFVQFIARAQAAVDRLAERHERHVWVFCHGHFISAVAWLLLSRPVALDSAAMRRFYQFIHGYAVPNCSILPLYLHPCGARSLGGLWLPPGVEVDDAHVAQGGLAGV